MKRLNLYWKFADSQILLLSLALGAYWGAFIDLQWNELVEVGLVLSGSIEAYVPWHAASYFSSQSVFSALLFKTGIGLDMAAIILSAMTVALAFTSISAVVLIFTDIKAVALLTPILLCKFPFYNFHYYPVKFPNYNYVFAQIGMYWALLTISLIVLRKTKIAYFLAGILCSIHLMWGVGCILFLMIYNVISARDRINKQELLCFSLSIIISLTSFFYFQQLQNQLYERQKIYSATSTQESHSVEKKFINDSDLFKDKKYQVSDAHLLLSRADQSKSGRSSHNLLLRDSQYPILEGFKFFLPEISLFFLIYLLSRNQMLERVKKKKFVQTLIILQGLLVIYKLIDEVDPSWTLLGSIHPNLVDLMMRAMPHRILNLDSIILPSILICLLAKMAFEKDSLIFKGFFLLLLICPFMSNTAGKNLGLSELLNLLLPQLLVFGFSFSFVYIYLILVSFKKAVSN